MESHLGGILDLFRAPPVGDVMGQRVGTIGVNGYSERRWEVNFEALTITNLGATTITVMVGPLTQSGTVPSRGTGIISVPPGIERTVPARGTALTLYGEPGTIYELVAYTRPRPPHSSVVSNGPGGGVLLSPGTTANTTFTLSGIGATRILFALNLAATTGGVTLNFQGLTASGYLYPLFTAPVEITALGVTCFRIGPSLTPTVDYVANDIVPPAIVVAATVTGTATYGVDYVTGR